MGPNLCGTPCTPCTHLLLSPTGHYRGWKLPLLPLCLLCATITGAVSVRVTVSTPSVQVRRGGSVLLPCSFHSTAAPHRLNIIWTVSPLLQPQRPLQVIVYERGQIVESLSEYTGRVKFAFHPTTDASILINQSRSSDTGTYQCTVINPPDGATPNIGLIGLTVLVAPSRPECSSEGREEEGGTIRLQCSIREGVPPPRFLWEKLPPGEAPAPIPSQQGELQGSVTLNNITPGTSGLYRCTVSNPLGSHSCPLRLHIRPALLSTVGIIVGVALTLIMGAVLLALLAIVLHLHQRSRGNRQEQGIGTCKVPGRWEVPEPAPGKTDPVSPGSGAVLVGRGTGPRWVPGCQAQQSPASIRGEESGSEDDEDLWERSPGSADMDPEPVLSASYYSTNSGFLV